MYIGKKELDDIGGLGKSMKSVYIDLWSLFPLISSSKHIATSKEG